MTIMLYVDASFRGRRDMASGIAAMLLGADGRVRGRAALGVMAKDSHHAEGLAAVLGLQMAVLVPNEKLIVLYSDSEALVKQIAKNRAIDAIKKIMSEARDNGIEVKAVHLRAKDDKNMAHVDYLSKSITTE